jgi:hypothetical protein
MRPERQSDVWGGRLERGSTRTVGAGGSACSHLTPALRTVGVSLFQLPAGVLMTRVRTMPGRKAHADLAFRASLAAALSLFESSSSANDSS